MSVGAQYLFWRPHPKLCFHFEAEVQWVTPLEPAHLDIEVHFREQRRTHSVERTKTLPARTWKQLTQSATWSDPTALLALELVRSGKYTENSKSFCEKAGDELPSGCSSGQ